MPEKKKTAVKKTSTAIKALIVFATHYDDSTSEHKAFLPENRKEAMDYARELVTKYAQQEIDDELENTVTPKGALKQFNEEKWWSGVENGVRFYQTKK